MNLGGNLSKREHQIMDLAYERGSVSSGELEELLSGNLSNSTVRVHLRILESKGFLTHTEELGRFTYRPTKPREAVAIGEISRLLSTFFGGSLTAAVATMLDQQRDKLTQADIADLRDMIDRAAKEQK
jgi:BlaI family penicillinase repressor